MSSLYHITCTCRVLTIGRRLSVLKRVYLLLYNLYVQVLQFLDVIRKRGNDESFFNVVKLIQAIIQNKAFLSFLLVMR